MKLSAPKRSEEDKKEQLKKFYLNCAYEFPFFTEHSLKIRNKSGETVPLVINKAQQLIHDRLEHQLKTKGKVRAVIIKGRQQGISTYVQARFFWKLIHNKGLKAFILTHLSEATQHLFSMAKRFYDSLPLYRPELSKSNYHELNFKSVDCGYKVGTAGSTGVGRGETIQLFHGSEVAFYPNADEHFSGILQAVSDQDGTEVIFESTANGTNNLFHRLCMESANGNSGFELIFIPWTLQDEYAVPVVEPMQLSDEEQMLVSMRNLTLEQINWRREKIKQFGDVRRFKQEYPLDLNEAFMVDAEKSFIQPMELHDALNPDPKTIWDTHAPIIIGVDPSAGGRDFTGYAMRAGRQLIECGEWPKEPDTMKLVARIIKTIQQHKPIKVFIDKGTFGTSIYDRLRELGYTEVVGIHFGESAEDFEKYHNKRAEMYGRMKEWFNSSPCKIPKHEKLIAQICSVQMKDNLHERGKMLLESKDVMRSRGIPSPDIADAFALTFAENTLTNVKYTPQYINQYSNPKFNISWDPFSI